MDVGGLLVSHGQFRDRPVSSSKHKGCLAEPRGVSARRIQIGVGQAEMSEAESEVRRGSDAAVRPRPNYLTTTPLAASPALPGASVSSDPCIPRMDQSDDQTPHRKPRQQLSCVQCRRRKVKCDHERPCKRCRIRGWDSQCTYPLLIPPGPADTESASSSPRRTSIGRALSTATPSLVNRPAPPNSTYGSPSAPTDLATPESITANLDSFNAFAHGRSPGSAPPQLTYPEPAALATPVSASPHNFPRPPSVAHTILSEKQPDQDRSKSSPSTAVEPRDAPEYALYLINGESIYFGRSSCPWLISKVRTM